MKWNYFSYILTIHTETTCFSVYFLLIIYLNCPLKKANDSMTKYNDVSTFDPAQAYPTHSPSPLENPHFFYTPRSKMTENMLWNFQGSSARWSSPPSPPFEKIWFPACSVYHFNILITRQNWVFSLLARELAGTAFLNCRLYLTLFKLFKLICISYFSRNRRQVPVNILLSATTVKRKLRSIFANHVKVTSAKTAKRSMKQKG